MQKEGTMSSRPRPQTSVMRGSRMRNFVIVAGFIAALFMLYLLSDANQKWTAYQLESEKCQQRRDSLSAQLQVTFEHKGRLDKALQEEKAQHAKTKEDFDSFKQMQQNVRERDQETSLKQISSFKDQVTKLQNQNDDLRGENNKFSSRNENLMNEAKQIENDYRAQIQQKDLKLKSVLDQVQALSSEKVQLVNKVIELKSALKKTLLDLHKENVRVKSEVGENPTNLSVDTKVEAMMHPSSLATTHAAPSSSLSNNESRELTNDSLETNKSNITARSLININASTLPRQTIVNNSRFMTKVEVDGNLSNKNVTIVKATEQSQTLGEENKLEQTGSNTIGKNNFVTKDEVNFDRNKQSDIKGDNDDAHDGYFNNLAQNAAGFKSGIDQTGKSPNSKIGRGDDATPANHLKAHKNLPLPPPHAAAFDIGNEDVRDANIHSNDLRDFKTIGNSVDDAEERGQLQQPKLKKQDDDNIEANEIKRDTSFYKQFDQAQDDRADNHVLKKPSNDGVKNHPNVATRDNDPNDEYEEDKNDDDGETNNNDPEAMHEARDRQFRAWNQRQVDHEEDGELDNNVAMKKQDFHDDGNEAEEVNDEVGGVMVAPQ